MRTAKINRGHLVSAIQSGHFNLPSYVISVDSNGSPRVGDLSETVSFERSLLRTLKYDTVKSDQIGRATITNLIFLS